ncbi:MAG: hypothetical protein LBK59_06975 [Bifidobacteriaceae bacterium]|jgi:hypothetical protein|nr:hypothetical protein [Bifidobacteriaceae bacterium]
MRKHKVLGSVAAFALTVGVGFVVAVPAAAPAAAAGCTINSMVQSGRDWNVTANAYCSNGYQFRARQYYSNGSSAGLVAYGAWRSVATSTATRPVNTTFGGGDYQLG